MYADFGGSKSSSDPDSAATAAREFHEEGNRRIPFGFVPLDTLPRAHGERGWVDIAESLRAGAYTARFDFRSDNGAWSYTTYLKQVPFLRSLSEDFENAYIEAIADPESSSVYTEKDAVSWVSTERLLSLATSSSSRGGIQLRPHFKRRIVLILREFPWAKRIGTPKSNAERFRKDWSTQDMQQQWIICTS